VLRCERVTRFRKGQSVVQLFEERGRRYASPHAWVVTRVRAGVVYIGDAHGESRWSYRASDGGQRETDRSFRSEIVIVRR
jgi:hypothetical protein